MTDKLAPELFQVLIDLQEKLNSSVFNGGFEKLVGKVDTMAENQEKLVTEFTKVRDAVYEPDKGLFTRIKVAESTAEHQFEVLQARVKSLETTHTNLRKYIWTAGLAALGGVATVVYDLIRAHVAFK